MNKRFPNFLIVGSPKCGTTTLYNILSDHPEIFLTDPKEPQFFSKGRYLVDHDWDWYHGLFKHVTTEKAIGEASVGYTVRYPRFWADPELIYHHLPEAKIIYMVRNPLERISSHYVNSKIIGYPKDMGSFRTAVKNHPMLIDTCRYWSLISPYIKLYGKENVQILFFEDMKTNPDHFFSHVFEFLNVSHHPIKKIEHANPTPDHEMDRDFTGNIRKWVGFESVRSKIPEFVKVLGRRLIKHRVVKPKWNKDLKKFVLEALAEDTKTLLRFCEKPVSYWSF
ncbi:MAG: sulfotransferase domain-containing protein [Bacteroidota bacterium]